MLDRLWDKLSHRMSEYMSGKGPNCFSVSMMLDQQQKKTYHMNCSYITFHQNLVGITGSRMIAGFDCELDLDWAACRSGITLGSTSVRRRPNCFNLVWQMRLLHRLGQDGGKELQANLLLVNFVEIHFHWIVIQPTICALWWHMEGFPPGRFGTVRMSWSRPTP